MYKALSRLEEFGLLTSRWEDTTRSKDDRAGAAIARHRIDEIDADLYDHVAHERAHGTSDWRIAAGIGSRMLRGLAADASWRGRQAKAATDHPLPPEKAMRNHKTAYRSGVGVAIATALFLLWLMGAAGVIGVEGDRADLMYFGVLAVGVVGAVIARFRPSGMARALLATASAQALVAVIALIAGKHQAPNASVAEIVGLNGIFVALFVGSAWLFRRAARRQPPANAGPRA